MVFGLVDWLAIPAGTRAKRIGLWHGVGNVVVVALFAVSWLLRRGQDGYVPTGVAFWLQGRETTSQRVLSSRRSWTA